MSYPLGVHYHVPHGMAGAVFLPYVVEQNLARGVTDYAELYTATAGADQLLGRDARARAFAARLREVWDELGIPTTLARFGVGDDIDPLVRDTLDLGAALDQNPVPFGEAELRQILGTMTGVA